MAGAIGARKLLARPTPSCYRAEMTHHRIHRPPIADALRSFVGAFLGIGSVAFMDQFLLADSDLAYVIGAFGATAVLVFAAPASPLAQPWNVVVGHVVSALIGVALFQLLGPSWLAAALAVSLAIFAMQMTRSTHPPGGASALIAVAGSPQIHDLGFLYALFPVAAGALVLVGVALITNNFRAYRRWPEAWY